MGIQHHFGKGQIGRETTLSVSSAFPGEDPHVFFFVCIYVLGPGTHYILTYRWCIVATHETIDLILELKLVRFCAMHLGVDEIRYDMLRIRDSDRRDFGPVISGKTRAFTKLTKFQNIVPIDFCDM